MTIGDDSRELLFSKHVDYIANHGNDKNDYVSVAYLVTPFRANAFGSPRQEYCMTEFLRMSGIYWGVTGLDLMDKLERLEKQSIIEFIKRCQCPVTGGIAACEGHDPHLLYTLSAVQILVIYDSLGEIDTEMIAKYVESLQQLDGSFFGDKWGEVDTRFSFCAVAILSLIVSFESIRDRLLVVR